MLTSVAIGALGAIVVGEGVARLVAPHRPKASRLDPVIGWRGRPRLRYQFGREGAGVVTIATNRAGYRDVDHAPVKPPGTLRVAVLGNSVVEAREVALEDTFWKRLEGLLEGRLDRPVEVLNLGLNGYSTAQSLLTLPEALAHDVDCVVHVFVPFTDVTHNVMELGQHKDRPYFRTEGDAVHLESRAGDSPTYRRRARKDAMRAFFYDHLRLLQLLRERRVRRTARKRALRERGQAERLDTKLGVFRAPDDPHWRKAWEVSRGLIADIARRCRDSGTDYVLAVYPIAAQADSDSEEAARLRDVLGVEDLDHPDRACAAIVEATGVPCLHLSAPLRSAMAEGNRPLFCDVIHLNPAGHAVTADALAAMVAERVHGGDARDGARCRTRTGTS